MASGQGQGQGQGQGSVRAVPITRARQIARQARRYGYFAEAGGRRGRVTCPECRTAVTAEFGAGRTVTACLDEAMVTHLSEGWCPSHPHPLDSATQVRA